MNDGIRAQAGLEQELSATLQPWTTYTLRVEVGNMGNDPYPPHSSFDFGGFPGYRVELLAGSPVIPSDDDTPAPAEGTFATSTVEAAIAASHARLGQPLAMVLLNTETGACWDARFSVADSAPADTTRWKARND